MASVCTRKLLRALAWVAVNIPQRSCHSSCAFISNSLMSKNKRKTKLPFCKNVRLSLFGVREYRPRISPRHMSSPRAAPSPASQFPPSKLIYLNSNAWENAGTIPNFWRSPQRQENIFRSPFALTEPSWTMSDASSFLDQQFSPVTFGLLALLWFF